VKENFLIYGCNGYTGKLISEHAVKAGLKPILAGRDAQKVEALANELGLSFRVFEVKDEETVVKNIQDVKAVLHCAGPFRFTSKIMAAACIKAKTHYLDITGEYDVFESMFALDEAAKQAGILIMPGVGFDVVPSDCLALYLKDRIPGVDTLELALMTKGGRISHGTAITVAENLGDKTMVRRDGKLEEVENGSLIKKIKFEDKRKKDAVAISWGDISTAYRSTGIPNITVYNCLPPAVIKNMQRSNYIGFLLRWRPVKNFIINRIKQRPAGPNEEERETASSVVWGEVRNSFGAHAKAQLNLPEGYTLTAMTAVKIAQSILEKEPPHGSYSPASVFGADFILQFDKVKRFDLA
jgi:short subunit dehydrogenase-like uncharacterized protein